MQLASAEAPVQEETIPEHIADYKWFAYQLVEYKWSKEQWEYFDYIITKESNWNPTAQNPTSTAYGTAQFLDSTWSTVGCKKTDAPDIQIKCAVKYIEQRYGNPQQAYIHHIDRNWY